MDRMAVSLKVLQNKAYTISPVLAKNKWGSQPRPEDIIGIKLLYANSGMEVWEKNGGVIKMDELSQESQDYVIGLFTDFKKRVAVFGELGD